jgi:hypothetical protein
MGVGRQLGKGDRNQLQYLEDAFNRATGQTLSELRRELLAGTPVIAAVAATVLVGDRLLSQWNQVGVNWFGPSGSHQWLEPCTPPDAIQDRVRTAWTTMVDLALARTPKARIELWAKCGHPNFEALVTSRHIGTTGLVIVTLLTPDMRGGYGDWTPTHAWQSSDNGGDDSGNGYGDIEAVSIGTQAYPISEPARAEPSGR